MKKILFAGAIILSLFGVVYSEGEPKPKPKKVKKPKMTKEERAAMMQEKAEKALKAVDTDENGSVSLEEFLEWKKAEFTAKDADGDAALSAIEFVSKPKKAKKTKAPKEKKNKKDQPAE